MADQIDMLRSFVCVARTLNFTKAAKLLKVSPATLSRTVAALERQTGQALLNRSTRAVALTTQGEAFVRRCEDILSEMDALLHEGTGRREIRIAASIPFYDFCLTEIFTLFHRAHPEVKLHCTVTSDPLDLIAGAYDIGFQEGSLPPEGYVARYLGSIETRLYAAPAYLEARGRPQTLKDLHRHTILSLSQQSRTWQFEKTGGKDAGPVDLAVHPAIDCNFSYVLRDFCLRGAGIAFLPVAAAQEFVDAGALEVVLARYTGVPHRLYGLAASRRNLSPLVRTLLDFVKEETVRCRFCTQEGG